MEHLEGEPDPGSAREARRGSGPLDAALAAPAALVFCDGRGDCARMAHPKTKLARLAAEIQSRKSGPLELRSIHQSPSPWRSVMMPTLLKHEEQLLVLLQLLLVLHQLLLILLQLGLRLA